MEETCLFKVKFWSSVTPRILMVSEKGIEMPAILGMQQLRVPVKIDSNILLLRDKPL